MTLYRHKGKIISDTVSNTIDFNYYKEMILKRKQAKLKKLKKLNANKKKQKQFLPVKYKEELEQMENRFSFLVDN